MNSSQCGESQARRGNTLPPNRPRRVHYLLSLHLLAIWFEWFPDLHCGECEGDSDPKGGICKLAAGTDADGRVNQTRGSLNL